MSFLSVLCHQTLTLGIKPRKLYTTLLWRPSIIIAIFDMFASRDWSKHLAAKLFSDLTSDSLLFAKFNFKTLFSLSLRLVHTTLQICCDRDRWLRFCREIGNFLALQHCSPLRQLQQSLVKEDEGSCLAPWKPEMPKIWAVSEEGK